MRPGGLWGHKMRIVRQQPIHADREAPQRIGGATTRPLALRGRGGEEARLRFRISTSILGRRGPNAHRRRPHGPNRQAACRSERSKAKSLPSAATAEQRRLESEALRAIKEDRALALLLAAEARQREDSPRARGILRPLSPTIRGFWGSLPRARTSTASHSPSIQTARASRSMTAPARFKSSTRTRAWRSLRRRLGRRWACPCSTTPPTARF